MANYQELCVGVMQWEPGNQITMAVIETLGDLGCEVIEFSYTAILPAGLDIILARGPLGSLTPVGKQLMSLPLTQRPALALWMCETWPNPILPKWMVTSLGMIRAKMEALAFRQNSQGAWQLDPRLKWLTIKGWRFRNYGELDWLHRQGLLSALGVSSLWYAEYLRAMRFDPLVAPLGIPQGWAANLELKRDIPVLWLGEIGSDRRGRLLDQVRADLGACGIEMLRIDGIENPYMFGAERTVLLNRTQIVLNLMREEWDNNALRLYLAAANRCLVVTEPILAHTTFTPGLHLVEAPVAQIAGKISYYLAHPAERQPIIDRTYQLVMAEYTMEQAVRRILDKVVAAGRASR
ncbi:MAG: glycosyltransferase family 1 protein [Chloroflexi bacterium]|nr:glycosyltransferase family 1 protein [Chloroflexota bacterium]